MIQLLVIPGALRIAWTLVHFLWQGLIVGLMAWAILTLMRRQSAQLRYIVACGFLLACLAAPVVTFFRLAPPPSVTRFELSPSPSQAPIVLSSASSSSLQGLEAPQVSTWVLHLRSRLVPLLPWILGCWMAGVVFFGIRSVGGWIWLQRLKFEGAEVSDGYWREQLSQMALCVGIRRTVRFLECGRIFTPMATGILRPIVMVPLGFFANLDPLAVEAILAHELAHIHRLDVLANGVQCAIETLLFFHPVVWWISRRIRIEREHCCDDSAIQACGDPVVFAETLNRLVTLREFPTNAAVRATGGHLLGRIRRLLVPDLVPIRFTAPSLSLLIALSLGVTMLAAQQEMVRQTFKELPSRFLEVGEVAMRGAEVKVNAATQAVSQFVPQPGDFPEAYRVAPVVVPNRALPPVPQEPPEALPVALSNSSSDAAGSLAPAVVLHEEASLPDIQKMPDAEVEILSTLQKNSSRHGVWPEGASFVAASSLPFSVNPPNFEGDGAANAFRVIYLSLEPGEHAMFRLQAEDSRVAMEARIPYTVSSLAWKLALKKANFPPRAARSVKLEIRNPTREPQKLELTIFGTHGYSYRIDLTRTAGEIKE